MRLLVSVLVAALLAGCIPIGIRGGTMPDRSFTSHSVLTLRAALNGS